MKVLSLFDGIAGAFLALDSLGIEVGEYFASEIDDRSIDVAEANWGDRINQLGDISYIDGYDPMFRGVDLLIGGSPCTNLSIAGDKTGLEGGDSRLFYDYMRLLADVNPRYFLLENVQSMKKDDRERITEYFSEIVDVRQFEINSSVMTAQSRRRLYWTNIPEVAMPRPSVIQVSDILEHPDMVDPGLFLTTKQTITPKKSYTDGNWTSDRDMMRILDIGTGRQGERIYSRYGKSVNITSSGGGPGGKTGMYLIRGYGVPMSQADIMGCSRRLTAIETERLQGIPDDYTKFGPTGKEISRTQRQKMVGNGFTVPVVAHILSPLVAEYGRMEDMDYQFLSRGG